ncbi:hypothetical protein E2C01_039855 [Portunus trituberculatus]|uniref:Uncharacterized protein n=1 Tax=Portunus trituberculatus TaxID=210409 RepID=A0A5B7FKW3_PORTR|nr:hypothetical protein [Portunus trituberculatus]
MEEHIDVVPREMKLNTELFDNLNLGDPDTPHTHCTHSQFTLNDAARRCLVGKDFQIKHVLHRKSKWSPGADAPAK